MGLIGFLKKLFSQKPPNPSRYGRFEDLYNYDFPELLKKCNYIGEYVNPYDDEKLKYFDYECTLNPTFLDAFDTIVLRLRNKKKEIEPDYHIDITLFSKRKTIPNERIAYVVDSICEAWKDDPHANPNGTAARFFKEGRPQKVSFDQNECMITLNNEVEGGLSVEFYMIYNDMKRIGRELKH